MVLSSGCKAKVIRRGSAKADLRTTALMQCHHQDVGVISEEIWTIISYPFIHRKLRSWNAMEHSMTLEWWCMVQVNRCYLLYSIYPKHDMLMFVAKPQKIGPVERIHNVDLREPPWSGDVCVASTKSKNIKQHKRRNGTSMKWLKWLRGRDILASRWLVWRVLQWCE